MSGSDVDAKLLLASLLRLQGQEQAAEALFREIAGADLAARDLGTDDWAPRPMIFVTR